MQSVGIYIAVLTCDFGRNDRTLEGLATFIKMKKESPGNWVRVSEGALVHLEGTTNSFWGKKHSCFRYFKHKAYLGLSKTPG